MALTPKDIAGYLELASSVAKKVPAVELPVAEFVALVEEAGAAAGLRDRLRHVAMITEDARTIEGTDGHTYLAFTPTYGRALHRLSVGE